MTTITSITFHKNKICSVKRQLEINQPSEKCFLIHGYTTSRALGVLEHKGHKYQPYAAYLPDTPFDVELESGKVIGGVYQILNDRGIIAKKVVGIERITEPFRRVGEEAWTPTDALVFSLYAVEVA